LLLGGESNQPQKALIGSTVKGTWQDKGHFNMGFDVPFHLKLQKQRDEFTSYSKQKRVMFGRKSATKSGHTK